MIVVGEKKDVAVSSAFKTSSFSIQASAKAFEILSSNIYTNKVRAVIREISCNAHDSHVAAKNPAPFKVHLPTWLEPVFSVRDFGIGLDDESIREIFTTYFSSTKTGSNDYIGALGLGSKSPFCLVDSFTVTSWKNGMKNVYSCYKDENGEPQIANLTSESSDEPSGLEVSMSVEKHLAHDFKKEATFVFKYFDSLPVINIAEVVETINKSKDEYNLKTDKYALTNSYGTLYAIMGNVAYDIGEKQSILGNRYSGYIKFDIGELSFDPGRENLSYDKKTTEAVENKLRDIAKGIAKETVDKILLEPNKFKRGIMADSFSNIPLLMQDKSFRDLLLPKAKTAVKFYYHAYSNNIRDNATHDLVSNLTLYRYMPKYERRIKAYIRNNRSVKIALVTDEVIQQFDIPDECLNDLKTLPAASSTRSSGYKVDKNIYTIPTNGCNTQVAQLPSGPRVYVSMYSQNYQYVKNGEQTHIAGHALQEQLRSLAELGIKFDLYGVRCTVVKTKTFQKDKDWIEYGEFVEKELDKLKLKMYNDTHDNLNEMVTIAEQTDHPSFEKLIKIKEEVDNSKSSSVTILKKYFDIDVEVSNELVDEVDFLSKKYEMLTYIPMWRLEKNVMTNYIDLVNKVS